ncbi:MAG TPA: hypothetical protein VFQ61_26970, partial [Polyangiaceae bacterium]|nr:hypothetical protein [Polyangiaceae bacterium]
RVPVRYRWRHLDTARRRFKDDSKPVVKPTGGVELRTQRAVLLCRALAVQSREAEFGDAGVTRKRSP